MGAVWVGGAMIMGPPPAVIGGGGTSTPPDPPTKSPAPSIDPPPAGPVLGPGMLGPTLDGERPPPSPPDVAEGGGGAPELLALLFPAGAGLAAPSFLSPPPLSFLSVAAAL